MASARRCFLAGSGFSAVSYFFGREIHRALAAG
jgi:hypothetical protein